MIPPSSSVPGYPDPDFISELRLLQQLGPRLPNNPFSGEFDDEQLQRANQRFRLKYVAGVTRSVFPGDSYALGVQASTLDASYYGRLKASLSGKFVFSNYGVSGKALVQYLQNALFDGTGAATMSVFQPVASDLFTCILGLNDLRGSGSVCGSNPANLPQMQARAQALASWLLIPEASKVRLHGIGNTTPNPAVTFTGTWSHAGFGGEPNFSFSSTAGATASFTTPVGNMLVLWVGVDTGSTNSCTATVDGVPYTWSTASTYDSWSMSCVIIPLPTTTAHSVTLTQVGAGNMMVAAAGCVDNTQDFGGTLIWSGPAYLTDASGAGWSDAGGALNGAAANSLTGYAAFAVNNGGSDRFSAALEQAMSQLFSLGFNVVNSRARNGFVPVAMIGPDKVHPNDVGYDHLFRGLHATTLRVIQA